MLVHINKHTAIQWNKVEVISYKKESDTTVFKTGSTWHSAKGEWVSKIEAALQVCAVAVYKTHYVLKR